MYLAAHRTATGTTYQIRQSYQDSATGWLNHRLIFDLGPKPADHMEIMADVAVFFSGELENTVSRYTDQDTGPLLEQLLWQFLPHPIRQHLSRFHRTERYVPGPVTGKEKEKIEQQIHIFDRRRLYYLHYRAIDQSRLYTLRDRALRPFLDQCRDEREYCMSEREKALTPGEYRNYIFAIFNLQRFFNQSFATFLPEALPEDEVADRFVESLCDLNQTPSFWSGETFSSMLHPHLVRYLVMFFDFAPAGRSFEAEYVRRFMNNHRTFRWPKRNPTVSEERISEIFGRSHTELKKMKRKELSRLYRKIAKKLHPDQGGDQASFVELTEVYSTLLSGK